MYATSEKDLIEQYDELLLLAAPYPAYVSRLEKYFERREEWTLYDRQKYIIRGHNTNNFAEASIRIIKDIVLCRTKAFNVVALTDFILNVYENFLCLKLLEFANGRRNSMLSSRLNKTYNVPFEECVQISPQLFLLPSSCKENIMYEVNVNVGYCTCQRGRTGAFCKHQSFLFRQLEIQLPNAPVLSTKDRLELAYIASGEQNLNEEFYRNLNDPAVPTIDVAPPNNVNYEENVEIKKKSDLASSEEKEDLLKEIKRLLMSDHSKNSINRLTTVLKNKKKPEEIKSCLTTMALAVNSKNYKRSKEKKIKVQPTSVGRRLPKGSQRIISKKRQHAISKNITNNIRNAK